MRSPRTAARFEEVISPWYGPFLADHGLPEASVWLELFPLAIYGDGGDALLAQAEAAVAGDTGSAGAIIGYEASEGFALGDVGGTVNARYADAGYAVLTWYYGGITVIAAETGQALEIAWVDGLGGDEEGIFELQGGTVGAVSAKVEAADGGEVRVAIKDTTYAVLYEEMVLSGAVFSWSDPEARILRVVVEADGGNVFVDDFAYGDAAEIDDANEDDTDQDDTDQDDTDDGETGAPGTAAPDEIDAGCGCSSARSRTSNAALIALIGAGLGWLRRRRRLRVTTIRTGP